MVKEREKEKWVKSTAHDNGDARELCCPKCGCEKILGLAMSEDDDWDPTDYVFLDLGKRVTCWECRHEFTITENCWKLKR